MHVVTYRYLLVHSGMSEILRYVANNVKLVNTEKTNVLYIKTNLE